MLGVGTILQPKARADDHWSVRPNVVLVEVRQHGGAGAPLRRTDGWITTARRWLPSRDSRM